MKALWAIGEGTIRGVREKLGEVRPLAYTTVMTVMDRLARKGVVDRTKLGRAHLYRPAVTQEAIRSRALERLVSDFFLGSQENLRRFLESGAEAGRERAAVENRQPIPELPPVAASIDPALL
jgi:predicted transcriptional regulator